MYCHKLSLNIKSVAFNHGKEVNWIVANFKILHLHNKVPIITHFCTQSNGKMHVHRALNFIQ